MIYLEHWLAVALVSTACAACSSSAEPAGAGEAGGEVPSAAPSTNPEGTGQPACERAAPPPPDPAARAVIVTSAALAPSFGKLALFHQLTGARTEIVTVEDICKASSCGASSTSDTAKAIKDYLRARAGLEYALLGGDTTVVPARSSWDHYVNPIVPTISFTENIATDFYYSDFSEWDTNGDGKYGDPAADKPDYTPEIAVGRLPVATPAEVTTYVDKVIAHATRFDVSKVNDVLLLSNAATTVYNVPLDSSFYFGRPGRTISLLPDGAATTKLYSSTIFDSTATPLSVTAETQQLGAGHAMVVHAGHGGVSLLTTEANGANAFTGDMAYALENATLPVFMSCACSAGSLAANGNSAGAKLVRAPKGGAIAYLGNSATGLGLAGGSQLIDEMLRHIKTAKSPRLGDALRAGLTNLPASDSMDVPGLPLSIPVISADSRRWTLKSVVLLGDPMLPLWSAPLMPAATASARRDTACSERVVFSFGAPVQGVLRVLAGDAVYEVQVSGSSATLALPTSVASVTVGVVAADRLFGYAELPL